MTLTEYLRANSLTETAFAARVGLTQGHLNRIRRGQVWPSRDVARRIVEATNGDVTPNDLLEPAA